MSLGELTAEPEMAERVDAPDLDDDADGFGGYTALFSNTARAHRAGRTRDWVVLYTDDGGRADQYTVITATRGPLSGRRVVAGREDESLEQAPRSAA